MMLYKDGRSICLVDDAQVAAYKAAGWGAEKAAKAETAAEPAAKADDEAKPAKAAAPKRATRKSAK